MEQRGSCSPFLAVSTQRETAKTLIRNGNYATVALFCVLWGRWYLDSQFRQFLAQFKLRRVFNQNREMAKQRSVSAVNTATYLFRPLFETACNCAQPVDHE
jgi:hypothetical protein